MRSMALPIPWTEGGSGDEPGFLFARPIGTKRRSNGRVAMMEFAEIFADDLPTVVYVYSSLVCMAALAAMALWMTRAPRAESLQLSYRRA